MDFDVAISIKNSRTPILIVTKNGQDPLGVILNKVMSTKELQKSGNSFDVFSRFLKFKKIDNIWHNMFSETYETMVTMDKDTVRTILDEVMGLIVREDVISFLEQEKYETPDLPDEFDESLLINMEVTRDQTYTKPDYVALVVFMIKIKAIAPLVARYISLVDIDINTSSALTIYHLISGLDNVKDDVAFIKIMGFISGHIDKSKNKEESVASRVLNKNITNESFQDFVGVSILLYLGMIATVDGETSRSSIVRNMYRLCMNKVAASKNLLINKPLGMKDEDGGATGVTDSFTSVTILPIGYIEEIIEAFSSMDRIISELNYSNINIDLETVDRLLASSASLVDRPMSDGQETIVAWVLFSMIESEYMRYFDSSILLNLRVVVAAILHTNGIIELSRMMMSTPLNDTLHSKGSNKKCTPEIESLLDSVFEVEVNKKAKSRQYGLSLLEENDNEPDNTLKELLLKPIIRNLASSKWLSHADSSNLFNSIIQDGMNDNIFSCENVREGLIRTLVLTHDNIKTVELINRKG